MTKRYYYNCPIKVLYMMKNFGVEFECPNEDFEDQDDGFTEPYFDFLLWEIEQPETINTLLDMLEDGSRIYVKQNSESIFNIKCGDLCLLDGREPIFAFPQAKPHLKRMKTIQRDGKQFFMPEVEND